MPDHYRILGLQRDASEADIKKAYRTLALKWHPDKNPDNKDLAERKFKEISNAFKLLSNPDDRAHYDRYGDEPDRPQSRGNHHGGGHGGFHEQELTPEDIFNMFFGMPPQRRGGVPRRQHHAQQGGGMEGMQINLMQLMPLLLIITFSLLSSLNLGSESPYSLRQSPDYSLERQTVSSGVRYWVSESFELLHGESEQLRKVEDRVESDNHRRVSRRCQAERGQRQRMMDSAGHYSGEERARMLDQANSFPLDWCEEKDRLDAQSDGMRKTAPVPVATQRLCSG
eukprot:CAMPEP_0119064504 /NCGR_PEP_ID=MMETSP1178-20130426/7579_1 /TAXON_ID=33656 /ORGANISM="unid sp, Strain CCMP2000" /LENGTH=282 /DNA_ID=CAMNT_0007045951 /DNA_START=39 /DNA_END=884 /DNA_ORIENTATION=-